MNTDKTIPAWVRILSMAAALAAVAIPATAQSNANAEAAIQPDQPNPNDQNVIQMSAFEVRTTQGQGYSTTNASSAFKTNQPLLDIPQSILVVTSDLIHDIGYINSSDILQYVGVYAHYEGESVVIRGTRVTDPYLDGIMDQEPYVDSSFIDSYEIIHGPSAVLYPNTSLGGVVLKSSKKPLPFNQNTITVGVDSWGGWRAVLDFTGPIGQLGEGKLSYRVVAMDQGGSQYFVNNLNNRLALHPTLEWDYKNTSVYFAYDVERFTIPVGDQGLLTPSGKLYTGAGWGVREDGNPTNNMMAQSGHNWRGSLTQKFSDSWSMKMTATQHESQRWAGLIESDYVDYSKGPTPLLTESAILNNEWHDFWGITEDFNGRYEIGGLPNQSSFGFNESIWKIIQIYPTYQNAATYATIPVTEQALNALYVPQPKDYTALQQAGGFGSGARFTFSYDNVYYQHQLDIVPNWVSLVAGWTYSFIQTINDDSLFPNAPYDATEADESQFIHRYGAIVHLTKDSVLYALQSTMFSPGSSPLFDNSRGPNVQGKSNEVGAKCAFWGGRISATVSAFKMQLTNQDVLGPGLNVANQAYFIPIGSTTTHGTDGNLSLQVTPEWDFIATFYKGTIRDVNNNPVGSTFENSLTAFTRYKFGKGSVLNGLTVGGGVSKQGGDWISSGGIIAPAGYNMPSLIKMHVGAELDGFVNYAFDRHVLAKVGVTNILDNHDPVGQQGDTFISPSEATTFTLQVTYKF